MFSNVRRRMRMVFGLCILCLVLFAVSLRHNPWTNEETFRFIEIEGVEAMKSYSSLNLEPAIRATDTQASFVFKQQVHHGSYPVCNDNFEQFSKVLRPSPWNRRSRQQPISIAVNLHESEAIIPALGVALVNAIQYLLPWYKVYISIYENGSKDRTNVLLSELAAALDHIHIDGIFIKSTHAPSNFYEQDRIVLLSQVRNLALDPLLPHAMQGTLIFLNDIIACASDILELIYQLKLQQADAVVGMDWTDDEAVIATNSTRDEDGTLADILESQPRLYDLWVTRGINGELAYEFDTESDFNPISPNEDWIVDLWSTQSEAIRMRWLAGLPFPIYSGWGGMVAFDASLFTSMGLQFRSSIASGWKSKLLANAAKGKWARLVDSTDYLMQDCRGASECQYVFRDIWNLRDGRARIAIAPRARAAYTIGEWRIMATFIPPDRGWLRGIADTNASVDASPTTSRWEAQSERIDWNAVTIPTKVICLPGRNETWQVAFEWSTPRYYVDPRYRGSAKNY